MTEGQRFQPSMSLRDWFAGMAMAGQLACPTHRGGPAAFAMCAYDHADAMLAEREADGHIHVELDFIPVEERLPESAGLCMSRPMALMFGEQGWRRGFWTTGPLKPRFTIDGCVPARGVTHWAEIPEIKT